MQQSADERYCCMQQQQCVSVCVGTIRALFGHHESMMVERNRASLFGRSVECLLGSAGWSRVYAHRWRGSTGRQQAGGDPFVVCWVATDVATHRRGRRCTRDVTSSDDATQNGRKRATTHIDHVIQVPYEARSRFDKIKISQYEAR